MTVKEIDFKKPILVDVMMAEGTDVWTLDFGNKNISSFVLCERKTKECVPVELEQSEQGKFKFKFTQVPSELGTKICRYDLLGLENNAWHMLKVRKINRISEWRKYSSAYTELPNSGRHLIPYIQKRGYLSALTKKFTHTNGTERKLIFSGKLDQIIDDEQYLTFKVNLRADYPSNLDEITNLTLMYRGNDTNFEMLPENIQVEAKVGNRFTIEAVFDKQKITQEIYKDSYMLVVHALKDAQRIDYYINSVTYDFYKQLNGSFRDVYQLNDKKKFLIQIALNRNLWIHYRDVMKLDTKAIRERESKALQTFKPNQRNGNILMFEKESQMAQDNAFALFKYLQNTPLKKKVFYVIDEKSSQTQYLEPWKDQVLYLYSEQYYKHVIEDQMIVASESLAHIYQFNMVSGAMMHIIRKKNNYFLQHGVIGIRKLGDVFRFKKSGYDFFNTSTRREQEKVVKYLGFPKSRVNVFGLPRWADLNRGVATHQKNLLYFPTWREYLAYLSDADFLDSEYFKQIKGFLGSSELHAMLAQYNITLKVFLHPKMRKFSSYFENDSIEILDSKHESLKELIKVSDGVISDYSSMVWDFAYQRKPVILFQFDQLEYEQLWGGFFDTTIWQFGPVVTTLPDLLQQIELFGINDAQIDETYRFNMEEQLGEIKNINERHAEFINTKLKKSRKSYLEYTSYPFLKLRYILRYDKKLYKFVRTKFRRHK
ncbi:CDP-glycerol glycerophosphotransferase family protein [Weissella minor]|uniref:Uncharacterized protein n=1 Tax=Weissella minor TaxID=1620 RepID=A0A0R2JPY5_9LACO|nr:CDP-glycerol glycerophosphotransferase family protein [Weissella minor]KRN76940.1 hypothetical protein IV67_GL000450 [Weissella minor]